MATGKDAALALLFARAPGSTGLTRSAVALSAPTEATNSETPAASLAYAISIGADTYALAPAFPVAPASTSFSPFRSALAHSPTILRHG